MKAPPSQVEFFIDTLFIVVELPTGFYDFERLPWATGIIFFNHSLPGIDFDGVHHPPTLSATIKIKA